MPTAIDGEIFLSCAEVAAACGVSRQTLWRWRQQGLIPTGHRRRGRALLFADTDVELIRGVANGEASQASAGSSQVYLDNAASSRPSALVRDAVQRAMLEDFGNPSSPHGSGLSARRALAEARESVASLVGADADEVVFTSGGTEANNLALQGCVARGIRRIVISAVEHPSVAETAEAMAARGVHVTVLPVGPDGIVPIESLEAATIDDRTLVSIQWANSETGVVQPIGELASIAKRRGGWFHSDAVQAAGKMVIDLADLPIDALTITSHKLHGPQGVGALVAKRGFPTHPLVWGGSQEERRRPGTENYPGITGFGVACAHRQATIRSFVRRTRAMRNFIEAEIRRGLPGSWVNGQRRVCNITNLTIPGIDGQSLVALLDARGIRVSQVSACSNMRPESSRVLRAMGLQEDDAYASIRISVSEDTPFDDCSRAVREIIDRATMLSGSPSSRPRNPGDGAVPIATSAKEVA